MVGRGGLGSCAPTIKSLNISCGEGHHLFINCSDFSK